ncbi:hypothetical protein AVEN_247573-1 [Araneus ventricosus]|uniref:Tc1-like transposase DDE domain-containing protein n=1 Tax=Araneus ventricosus TaxID=182803 RepID=A0A4Y2D9W2_ARAVE|nr:hypothetical protein AVEN_247573-1 [Araneus ventricosus]
MQAQNKKTNRNCVCSRPAVPNLLGCADNLLCKKDILRPTNYWVSKYFLPKRWSSLPKRLGTAVLEDLPLSDLRNVWFQHDGDTPHKVSSVQQYIRDTFQQQVIGYSGCVEWPPRSPDLNPLDFFLWGYIKQRVYATPLPTLKELRNRITDACASVSPAML